MRLCRLFWRQDDELKVRDLKLAFLTTVSSGADDTWNSDIRIKDS